MKLLVLTQAVDLDDPVLGFFHGWLEEFSRRSDAIDVICLKEGRHTLPRTVRVHSLGKERGFGRIRYAIRFYGFCTAFRSEYDAVFIHMNEEYVLLGGLLWRLWGKKIVLWRNHKNGSWRTKLACALSHVVCYTSPESFVAHSRKSIQMPVGINTQEFVPSPHPPSPRSMLFLGRLDSVKNPDVFVGALNILAAGGTRFHADIYGSPTRENDPYARAVRESAGALIANGVVSLHAAVGHGETPQIYGSHAIFVNLTASGSFDKTIGEAMASGCLVVAANAAVKAQLGPLFIQELTSSATADTLKKALAFSDPERQLHTQSARSYIEREHSLSLLAERLFGILSA